MEGGRKDLWPGIFCDFPRHLSRGFCWPIFYCYLGCLIARVYLATVSLCVYLYILYMFINIEKRSCIYQMASDAISTQVLRGPGRHNDSRPSKSRRSNLLLYNSPNRSFHSFIFYFLSFFLFLEMLLIYLCVCVCVYRQFNWLIQKTQVGIEIIRLSEMDQAISRWFQTIWIGLRSLKFLELIWLICISKPWSRMGREHRHQNWG